MRIKRVFLSCILLISLAWEHNCKASDYVYDFWTNLRQRKVPSQGHSQDVDLEAIPTASQSNQQELLNCINDKKAIIRRTAVYAIAGGIFIAGSLVLWWNSPQTDPLSSMTLYGHDELLSLMTKQHYFYETRLFQGMMGCVGGLSCVKSFFTYSQVDSTKKLEPATYKPTHFNEASNTSKKTHWRPKEKMFVFNRLGFFLPSLSSQYREIEKPRYQYAKELNIDFKKTPINREDLARFLLYSNLHTLDLRESCLTDKDIEILSMLGHNVKILDIRENSDITIEGLKSTIRYSVYSQFLRWLWGFSRLKELRFDARAELILDEGEQILRRLPLYGNRKLQIYGELQNKALLNEALQHEFFYINSSNPPLNHDENKILFTRQSVFLPHNFSEDKSLINYLISCQKTYQYAYKSALKEGEQKDITSFMQIKGLQDEFSLLAEDFTLAYMDHPIEEPEKKKLVIDILKIEDLTRYGFLKSLKIVLP